MSTFRLDSLVQLFRWVSLSVTTVAKSGKALLAATLSLALLTGLVPVGMSIAMANLIAAAPVVSRSGFGTDAGRRLVSAAIVYLVLLTIQGLVGSVLATFTQRASRKLDGRLRERVMRAALEPEGVRHLEDDMMRQVFAQARAAAPTSGITPGKIAAVLPNVLGYRLRLLSYIALLIYISWPIGIAFLLLTAKNQDEMQQALWRVAGAGGGYPPDSANYMLELATTPNPAKEVRVFGLERWVSERYRSATLTHIRRVWSRRRDFTPSLAVTLVLSAILHVASLVTLGFAALRGDIGLGELAFAIAAISAMTPTFQQDDMLLAWAASTVETIEHAEYVSTRPELRLSGHKPASKLPRRSVCFDGVSFRYPGSGTDVLTRLDLELRVGERLALVGLNGAGKTTLVKLLCRLYEPTAGRIIIDDRVEVATLDVTSWRRQLAVLFQDFLQLELSAADNVRYGAPDHRPRSKVSAVSRAAEQAGIKEAIEGLPLGWETPLSPAFVDGTSLSGGQWQRLALARALYAINASARLLVLDEPTASLDVRAEAALYDKVLASTRVSHNRRSDRALATLIVSHRFSTVRQADRIVLLSGGKIVEEGTHDRLLARKGLYAELFSVQAKRFVRSSHDGEGAPQ